MSDLENDYVQFVQWLLDDAERQDWFLSLSVLNEVERRLSLRDRVILLAHTTMNEQVLRLMAELVDPDVYSEVRAVLFAELSLKRLRS